MRLTASNLELFSTFTDEVDNSLNFWVKNYTLLQRSIFLTSLILPSLSFCGLIFIDFTPQPDFNFADLLLPILGSLLVAAVSFPMLSDLSNLLYSHKQKFIEGFQMAANFVDRIYLFDIQHLDHSQKVIFYDNLEFLTTLNIPNSLVEAKSLREAQHRMYNKFKNMLEVISN